MFNGIIYKTGTISKITNSNNYSETISAMKAEIQLAGPLILKDTDN